MEKGNNFPYVIFWHAIPVTYYFDTFDQIDSFTAVVITIAIRPGYVIWKSSLEICIKYA